MHLLLSSPKNGKNVIHRFEPSLPTSSDDDKKEEIKEDPAEYQQTEAKAAPKKKTSKIFIEGRHQVADQSRPDDSCFFRDGLDSEHDRVNVIYESLRASQVSGGAADSQFFQIPNEELRPEGGRHVVL